jgi:hypothetical protein
MPAAGLNTWRYGAMLGPNDPLNPDVPNPDEPEPGTHDLPPVEDEDGDEFGEGDTPEAVPQEPGEPDN